MFINYVNYGDILGAVLVLRMISAGSKQQNDLMVRKSLLQISYEMIYEFYEHINVIVLGDCPIFSSTCYRLKSPCFLYFP